VGVWAAQRGELRLRASETVELKKKEAGQASFCFVTGLEQLE